MQALFLLLIFPCLSRKIQYASPPLLISKLDYSLIRDKIESLKHRRSMVTFPLCFTPISVERRGVCTQSVSVGILLLILLPIDSHTQ